MEENKQQKAPPVAKLRMGRIHVAIWKNLDKEGRTFYTYTEERRYKDSNGNWQSTNSYSLEDALHKAKLNDQVDTKIRELLAENASQQPEAADAA